MSTDARPKSPARAASPAKQTADSATATEPQKPAPAEGQPKQRRPRGPRRAHDGADGAQPQPRPAREAPVHDPAEDARKVFVGNLPFSTTDQELVQHFSPAGPVERTIIARSFGKPKGFGFVVFAEAASVKAAIEMLNGSVIGEREVNVEAIAEKPATAAPAAAQQQHQQRTSAPRQRREHAPAAASAEGEQQKDAGDRKRRQRKPYPPRSEGEQAPADSEAKPVPRAQRQRRPSAKSGTEGAATTAATTNNNKNNNNNNNTGNNHADQKPRLSREQRQAERKARLEAEGVPLPTTVYVANVSETADDTTLAAAFSAKGYAVKKAYALRTRYGRPRGFGFVEFATTEDRDRAIAECQDLDVGGKHIKLTVAKAVPQKEGETKADGPVAKEETKSE